MTEHRHALAVLAGVCGPLGLIWWGFLAVTFIIAGLLFAASWAGRCDSTWLDHRCEWDKGHDGDHGEGLVKWPR